MVNYRLVVAGRKDPIFSQKALQSIYQNTGGSPRKIVALCHDCLWSIFLSGKTIVDEGDVEEIIQNYQSSRYTLV
jgi:type II secretory pathway predicted ATPase ExeA